MRGDPPSRNRRPKWPILLAVGFVVAVVITVVKLRSAPSGSFHSYAIYPHDSLDRLTFEDGGVTLHTCCGDSDWGSYRKDANGRWLWTFMRNGSPTAGTRWIVEPGAVLMTFTDSQSAISFTLRRRLFAEVPF